MSDFKFIPGEVVKIYSYGKSGLLCSLDGDTFYYNQTSLAGPRKRLKTGMRVVFMAGEAQEGKRPLAECVRTVDDVLGFEATLKMPDQKPEKAKK